MIVKLALLLQGGFRPLEHALELKYWSGGREIRRKK